MYFSFHVYFAALGAIRRKLSEFPWYLLFSHVSPLAGYDPEETEETEIGKEIPFF